MHIKQILLGVYIGTILNIYIYLKLSLNDDSSISNKLFFTCSTLIIYLISYFISSFLIKIIQKIKIRKQKLIPKKKRVIFFSLSFLVCASIGLIWFAAYAPGAFSTDSIKQYTQAVTDNYDDWHPVLHTLLVFKLPLSIFGDISSIIIAQIIIFSLVIAYSSTTIYSIAGHKWSFAFLLIVISNPIIFDELMYPWKDVSFAILALLISTIILKIYCSKGSWSERTLNLIFLGTSLAFCTIIRHNGILFTIPAIIFIYPFMRRIQWFKLFCIFISAFFIIKVPLYSVLQVSAPNKRTAEIVGLPITIIGNVAKQTPQDMDEELSNFIYNIATPETWQNLYVTGDFNSIKFTKANDNIIENFSPIQIFMLAAKAAIKSPSASLTAAFKLTHVVYGIEEIPSYEVIPTIQENNTTNIKYSGNETIKKIISFYRTLHDQSILKYSSFCGFTILIMLIFIISKNSKKDWRKILLCTPILFYDFGTMLFLTGPETRFFYINFITYPIIVVLANVSLKTRFINLKS